MKDVVEHPSFAQELGIADDRKIRRRRRMFGHDASNTLGSANGHGALVHNDRLRSRLQVRPD
jgi:hypothetical protein